MSDLMFKLFGGAIICVIVILVVKKESPESALGLRLIGGIGLAAGCVLAMSPVIEYVNELGESLEISDGLAYATSVLLKVLGVSLLTHICATVCRDSGEGSLAYYVELGGKIEILILSLPLMKEITEMALGLLRGVL